MKNELHSNIMNNMKKLKVNYIHKINKAIHYLAITKSITVCMSTSMLWFLLSGRLVVLTFQLQVRGIGLRFFPFHIFQISRVVDGVHSQRDALALA